MSSCVVRMHVKMMQGHCLPLPVGKICRCPKLHESTLSCLCKMTDVYFLYNQNFL